MSIKIKYNGNDWVMTVDGVEYFRNASKHTVEAVANTYRRDNR